MTPCPKCGWELHCGCNSCRRRKTYLELLHCTIVFEESEMCINCSHRMGIDEWEEYAIQLFLKEMKTNSLVEAVERKEKQDGTRNSKVLV